MLNKIKNLVVITSSVLAITACTAKNSPQDSTAEAVQQVSTAPALSSLAVNLNKYPANKVVCDPLTGGATTQTNYSKGIKASLYYSTPTQPRLYNSIDYVQFAKKSEQNLFLSDINVPTRGFTEGFSTKLGETLKDDSGNKLIEFFGLKMQTNIVLSPDDEEGSYEFALISDDGTTMKLKSGDAGTPDEVLIDNDGDHAAGMGCSTRTVRMRRHVMLPVEVTFYQGPRYHIANVLIWRKASAVSHDSLCGAIDSNAYWNADRGSEEGPWIKNLKNRGWKILVPDNFMMASDDYNPCVNATNPVISNFRVGEVILTSVSFSWTTDIAATSQVQLTNMTTSAVTLSSADNLLRTDHQLNISQLQSATMYKVKAISVSSDLGRTESAELTFRTQ